MVIDNQCTVSKEHATTLLNSFIDHLKYSIIHEGKVVFTGFGAFTNKLMPERNGFNPKTQKKITIPPKHKITFKMSDTIIF